MKRSPKLVTLEELEFLERMVRTETPIDDQSVRDLVHTLRVYVNANEADASAPVEPEHTNGVNGTVVLLPFTNGEVE